MTATSSFLQHPVAHGAPHSIKCARAAAVCVHGSRLERRSKSRVCPFSRTSSSGLCRTRCMASALEEFQQEVSQPDDQIQVLKAAFLIARHRYPDLDEATCVQQLDNIAVMVESELEGSWYPMRVVRTISKVMYEELGFKGNESDYYNYKNSCINMVLNDKTGIPITLALVFMEVGARLGLPLVGVNLPAHFMIRPLQPDLEVLVDPFNGEVCFKEDVEQRLSEVMGVTVQIDPSFVSEAPKPNPRAFLHRMLNNLKQAYLKVQDYERALQAVRYLRVLLPSSKTELRDEGLLLFKLQQLQDSKRALEMFLLAAEDEDEAAAAAVKEVLQQIDKAQRL